MLTPGCPLVTVGLPTYNRAQSYLKTSLQSALSQSYPHVEIVVSDNCSTDGTEELVKGVEDPRIRYFRHAKNIGATSNYNFCVQEARGDYFLLLHDDDAIDTDFVESCLGAVDGGSRVGIIRTGTRVIDGNGKVLGTNPNGAAGLSIADFMLGWFAGKTALYLCSTLFNTAGLREIGGFQSKTLVLQDVVAEMKLAARYGRADVPAVKASFRRHDDNRASAAKRLDWIEDSLFLLGVMCEVAPPDARERIRREGMAYFSRMNYRYVATIPSRLERLKAYYAVYKRFDYAYSPLRYVARSYVRGVSRRVRGAP